MRNIDHYVLVENLFGTVRAVDLRTVREVRDHEDDNIYIQFKEGDDLVIKRPSHLEGMYYHGVYDLKEPKP